MYGSNYIADRMGTEVKGRCFKFPDKEMRTHARKWRHTKNEVNIPVQVNTFRRVIRNSTASIGFLVRELCSAVTSPNDLVVTDFFTGRY